MIVPSSKIFVMVKEIKSAKGSSSALPFVSAQEMVAVNLLLWLHMDKVHRQSRIAAKGEGTAGGSAITAFPAKL